MNGQHVPDEGPPGLERHKLFLPFYEAALRILVDTITQGGSRTQGAKRVRDWFTKILLLDCVYKPRGLTLEQLTLNVKPAGCREYEDPTHHPLQKFFTRMGPSDIHQIREALGKLEALFFPTHELKRDNTPNSHLSICHAYFSALEKQNVFTEHVSDVKPTLELPEWEKFAEKHEQLIDRLEKARDKERVQFLRLGNLLTFALRRQLLPIKNQENDLAIRLIDDIVESGGIEFSLCRLKWSDTSKIVSAIADFRPTISAGSVAHQSLTAAYNYFAALESYLNIQRQIVYLFHLKPRS